MKKNLTLFLLLLSNLCSAQVYQQHTLFKDHLSIRLSTGILSITPMTDQAIRIQFQQGNLKEEREFVLINKQPVPAFRMIESGSQLKLLTKDMSVTFDKKSTAIIYSDRAGNIFLREKPRSRKLIPGTIMGEPCFTAEQSFDSPANESLFGLGQFQDGQFNLKNIGRKLIQVNSQIAIPFLYSSRGYGILWHQYGLTIFNPADNIVPLVKRDTASGANKALYAEVTTTSGTQRVSQRQSLFNGEWNVAEEGAYELMLDLGNMDNRHLVVIDGVPVIDQSNQWLPPAVSKLVHLKAGEHHVQVVCRSGNTPLLSWKKAGGETTFRSPNARSLDYVVFHGANADQVIRNYRNLSGNVPMLPLWAYGFWQCRERYTSGLHLVQTIEEFRNRQLPVDVIVQDWQYWGKYGWGVPKFDEANYPDPAGFIKRLHELNTHFSISVWENLDKKSAVAKPYVDHNLYLENSPWIDIYNPATQQLHWRTLNTNLFSYGVDSWWMDATEPENDALAGKQTYFGLGDFYRLTYPLFVSKAMYEGQRQTNPEKRVAILTRSAFPGQQRFGTINWSGDIGSDWDTYQRQIVAGLNYSLTGMPFWTTDIGGFFRPGRTQYTDPKYQDILTRWFQWGAFNSIFRIHGYQSETEPWKYGATVEGNMRKILNLRYRLLPYIYNEAWRVSSQGSTIMRPLIMDFQKDTLAVQQKYEYMFGRSLLVAPITEPNVSSWQVYLPKSTEWYDFWTGKRFSGGQRITASAPLDKIPLFVTSGAIVPLGKITQSTAEQKRDTLEIRIYPGADGQSQLYSDEGDNYNYEKGAFTVIPFQWNEHAQSLTIGKRKGSYKGALSKQVFKIVWVSELSGYGMVEPAASTLVNYSGERISIVKRRGSH
ncbi:MAG: TIM-barrel domain-containing protein [Bacteroidota bacterium]